MILQCIRIVYSQFFLFLSQFLFGQLLSLFIVEILQGPTVTTEDPANKEGRIPSAQR